MSRVIRAILKKKKLKKEVVVSTGMAKDERSHLGYHNCETKACLLWTVKKLMYKGAVSLMMWSLPPSWFSYLLSPPCWRPWKGHFPFFKDLTVINVVNLSLINLQTIACPSNFTALEGKIFFFSRACPSTKIKLCIPPSKYLSLINLNSVKLTVEQFVH